VRNANPDTSTSWGDFLMNYGTWSDPISAGVMNHLPGHNSSYKREVLLAYGDRLRTLLQAETVLHWDLRAKGYQLYLEPAAQVAHTNFGRLTWWLPAIFLSGRLFAATRAQSWSRFQRLAHTLGAPLIPGIRLRRILRDERRIRQRYKLPAATIPTLILGLVVSAAGEMVGYALGPSDSAESFGRMEFHRERYVKRG
jgi:hypothetical protein